ncbi:hypothetical protein IQ26_05805 [Mesorhizobium tianshanense]|uniref:Uncharacterized protein n=1 Tax=Mesorhizobium tianshanense TaxID=39844 RepID=A0A562N3S7_9HYPH|nr:hypothetical protein IQ26_05805 [Mesorhizobium tianshanense]
MSHAHLKRLLRRSSRASQPPATWGRGSRAASHGRVRAERRSICRDRRWSIRSATSAPPSNFSRSNGFMVRPVVDCPFARTGIVVSYALDPSTGRQAVGEPEPPPAVFYARSAPRPPSSPRSRRNTGPLHPVRLRRPLSRAWLSTHRHRRKKRYLLSRPVLPLLGARLGHSRATPVCLQLQRLRAGHRSHHGHNV